MIEQVNADYRMQEWQLNLSSLSNYFPWTILFFSSFSFQAHNSATVGNILMVVGRILEQVNAERSMQEGQFCLSSFF